MLGLYVPEIVDIGEEDALSHWKDVAQETCWAMMDLEEWLQEQHDLGDTEAVEYAGNLIDYMLENDLGYEYGGITPWSSEGYVLY